MFSQVSASFIFLKLAFVEKECIQKNFNLPLAKRYESLALKCYVGISTNREAREHPNGPLRTSHIKNWQQLLLLPLLLENSIPSTGRWIY